MAKNNVFKEVTAEYREKQFYASDLLEKRKKEVYKKIPEIETIHKELYETGFAITKLILNKKENTNELLENLKESNSLLQEKEKFYLKEAGFPENYFTNIYKCQLCKDTGFINDEKCSCLKQKLIDKYYDMSNLKNIIDKENFDTFDLRFYSDEISEGISPKNNIKNIYKIALNMSTNFEKDFTNLLFYGDTGLGKTFLCNCIAKEVLDKGFTVLYVTAPDIFKTLEDYRFNRDNMDKPAYYISMLTTVDLLVIDDLGTEVSTVVTSSELFNMVNTRFLNKKHTIISTNLTPAELEGTYSHRIESRFFGNYKMLKFSGEDIRILKKYGQ